MNSVLKHLSPANVASQLITMRSGRKEIFLIVEGGKDIALYSQVFALPRSNFVSCDGKERLMAVFSLAPAKGMDSGTIFIRDRDNDQLAHATRYDVHLLVSDLYDVEMHLLSGRLFERILEEYLKDKGTRAVVKAAIDSIIDAAAWVGALRKYGFSEKLPLDFDNLDMSSFIEAKTMTVDIPEMIRKVSARSEVNMGDHLVVAQALRQILQGVNPLEIACGKDVIEIIHLALSRQYCCAPSGECSAPVLDRTLRISATLDDLKKMSMYPILAAQVALTPFKWAGAPL